MRLALYLLLETVASPPASMNCEPVRYRLQKCITRLCLITPKCLLSDMPDQL